MLSLIQPITRFFTGDKTIKAPICNRLGLQVWRTLIARGLYKMRSSPVDADLQSLAGELLEQGLLIIPNFLSEAEQQAIREEARQAEADAALEHKTYQHGPNKLELSVFKADSYSRYPTIGRLYQDRRLVQLMQCAEKRKIDYTMGTHAYEHLTQGPDGDVHDPETEMHSDIFYHTHKAWYYLEDVNIENGPLVAVKRSHLLSLKALGFGYEESVGNNKGSRRIMPEELQALGLEETVLTVPKNTLVIANVHGYHCRRRGVPGKERFALHWTLRANPFRLTAG